MNDRSHHHARNDSPPVEAEIFECLTQQLREWENDGINVSEIRTELERPVHDMIEVFDEFSIALTELQELRVLVELYRGLGADEILDEIEPLLNDPSAIPRIRSKLAKAEQYIDFSDLKRKQFNRMIDDWRWAQIKVDRLMNLLEVEEDLDAISREFLAFEERYHEMVLLRDRLNDYDFSGREEVLEEIFFMLGDLDKLDEVKRQIEELE